MTIVYEPARVFQVWAYTVGMGRLLLRSPKSKECRTRVDVLFQNVRALKLGTLLPGLMVSAADSEHQRRIGAESGLLPGDGMQFFIVRGASHEGYVVAGTCVTSEDEGEYFDPSELWPAH